MHPHEAADRARPAPPLPRPVGAVVEALLEAGHEAYLVGGCVRGLLTGREVHDFDVATSASPEAVLALMPRAVPIGLRHGTIMVPTPAGPVDVTTYRHGRSLEEDLAHRDFTLNAIALDVASGCVIDPNDGLADLAAGRLRAVGRAAERLAEDPLRALRAVRFSATLGAAPDAELEAALGPCAPALAAVSVERVREELVRLLCAPHVARGLALLRRSGLEAALAPGVRPDAAAVVATLPRNLVLRLAAWLRDTRAAAILARLRFGRRRTQQVEKLLRFHPIDAQLRDFGHVSLRRLLARAGPETVTELLQLREAELDQTEEDAGAARRALAALRAALAEVQREGALALERQQLAIDGSEVMRVLGCGPGPRVGRALRYLTDRVLEDPSCNRPEPLRALLATWQDDTPDARERR